LTANAPVYWLTQTPKRWNSEVGMKFDENIPIFLQIKEEIENAIISKSIQEEEKIQSIRTLAQQYRLNPQTISSAVSELINEGILHKKRGIGLFVNKGAQQKLKKIKSSEFRKNELQKIIQKGRTLGITKNEILEVIEQIYKEAGGKK